MVTAAVGYTAEAPAPDPLEKPTSCRQSTLRRP
jgi:hypothetical protein